MPPSPADFPRVRRRLWRWGLPLIALTAAGAVVVVAAVFITNLRRQAVRSTAVVNSLLDIRQASSESDALAWSLVAQGFPNFSTSQSLRSNAARIRGDLRFLTHAGEQMQNLAIDTLVFGQELSREQQLIADHRLTDATDEAANGVDGTEQVLESQIDRLRTSFAARESKDNSHLYSGTLAALGLSAALVALLATAFAAGRRRALAAERTALRRSERRFRALVHKATEAVLITDSSNRITYAAGAVGMFFDGNPQMLIGRQADDLAPAEERVRARQLLDRVRREGPAPSPSEWTLVRGDGSVGHFEIQSADFSADPDVGGIVLTVRDVSARHEMESRLRHASLHDPLTGLPNRTLFEDRVTQALSRMRRASHAVALIYIDLDDFKAINDSLGHACGDELLCLVASRIDGALRASDTAARLGGDEFACLLDGVNEAEALAIARRLTTALEADATLSERTVRVRASIGLAVCADAGLTAEELIRNGDLAMYTAKETRRGGLAMFEPAMLADAQQRIDLREDLSRAIARDELSLAYQPLVAIDGRAIRGVEALLRWVHPEHGSIPPDRFIPLAEESGLIIELGRWVLRRALEDLVAFNEVEPMLQMSINVAPRELTQPDYVDVVQAELAAHGVAPGRLTLEIIESQLPEDPEVVTRLEALAAFGVRLSIDDFGTGQSSLARLQRLPVKQVKLDRSFLSGIDQGPGSATLVRSMLELGHALGLQMVAEGIERETQLELLTDLPCPLGQGYLFSRPVTADALRQLLAGTQPAPA